MSTGFLDPQTLAAIGSVELRSRLIVEGLMSGMHRSPMQGVSVEFKQHRPYVAGDDLRFLDWKIFGKTDKLHLKQYVKETNLDLLVMLDASGSMGYTSLTDQPAGWTNRWTKWNHACCVAAALTAVGLAHQDRVGLSIFGQADPGLTPWASGGGSGGGASGVRLSNASNHWQAVAHAMQRAEPAVEEAFERDAAGEDVGGGHTDLAAAIDAVVQRLTRRSLVVLISDLIDDPEHLEAGLRRLRYFRGRGHDALVLQVLDPAEVNFEFSSPTDFVGLEGEGRLGLDPAALRAAYREAVTEHLERVADLCGRFRFDHLQIDTSEALGPVLSHFFARRASAVSKR